MTAQIAAVTSVHLPKNMSKYVHVDRRTDRQPGSHGEANSRFSKFCERT